MRRSPAVPSRQRGVVAIVVALMLAALVGMIALVADLGHLFVTRTALQNAADAAALAGARELDGTAAGIGRAVAQANAVAAQNHYDFHNPVAGAGGGLFIEVGATPDAMVDASGVTSDAEAANKVFLRASTGERPIAAWFSRIWGVTQMRTSGSAVAGRGASELAVVAVCALPDDPANPDDNELGYERGVTYRASDTNPLAPGTLFWIDTGSNDGNCSNSTTQSLPFACAGRIPYSVPVGGFVYTNTGMADPQLEALDARFDVFNSKNRCDPLRAPPDRNIREYRFNANGAGTPKLWMQADPVQQSLLFVPFGSSDRPKLRAQRTFADYGVLWSAARPVGATPADWPARYGGTATNYPSPSPYAQTNGPFFAAPSHTPKAGRRMLNVAIIDCASATGGNCRPLRVLGYGVYFLQRKANVAQDKDIYLEFVRLLPDSFPQAEIRLYR